MVGVGGDLKSILKGLNELNSLNKPIWGMVDDNIKKMIQKKGFKTPPVLILKLLLKIIPSSVFGGVDFKINSDGSITLNYSDVGEAKKYFVANDEYFNKLKKDVLPTMKKELPNIFNKFINKF